MFFLWRSAVRHGTAVRLAGLILGPRPVRSTEGGAPLAAEARPAGLCPLICRAYRSIEG